MLMWSIKMTDELHAALIKIVPLSNMEIDFIKCIRDLSEIKPELLTNECGNQRSDTVPSGDFMGCQKDARAK